MEKNANLWNKASEIWRIFKTTLVIQTKQNKNYWLWDNFIVFKTEGKFYFNKKKEYKEKSDPWWILSQICSKIWNSCYVLSNQALRIISFKSSAILYCQNFST